MRNMYSDEIKPYLNTYYSTINKSKIKELIEYSIAGGKCVRGFIVKHIIETLTGKRGEEIPWQPIVSVEMIHAASIVIDDLPCMDNDTYRRGKLSTFKQFGNNEAILSSYYMISETLRIIINSLEGDHNISNLKTLANEWCELLGKNLVIGQFLDLKGDAESYFNIKFSETESVNDYIIKYKTCSLFSFTFLMGAFFSGKYEPAVIEDFKNMGLYFGIMFQLMDDYNDRDKDVPYANFFLSKGMEKTIEKYNESRQNLCLLLEKHGLYTDRFRMMIYGIDSMFITQG